jgi:hypothetical protein
MRMKSCSVRESFCPFTVDRSHDHTFPASPRQDVVQLVGYELIHSPHLIASSEEDTGRLLDRIEQFAPDRTGRSIETYHMFCDTERLECLCIDLLRSLRPACCRCNRDQTSSFSARRPYKLTENLFLICEIFTPTDENDDRIFHDDGLTPGNQKLQF